MGVSVKKSYSAVMLDLSSVYNVFPDIDIVGVKLSLFHNSMFVLVLYIPPNMKPFLIAGSVAQR